MESSCCSLFVPADFAIAGQVFYWSTVLVLITLVWTDFSLDECILGWGFNVDVYGLMCMDFFITDAAHVVRDKHSCTPCSVLDQGPYVCYLQW